MTIDFILLFILLNLCINNILLLDLLNQLNTNFIINTNQNNEVKCILDCELEIKNIINFYDNISQFKNIYHMFPIKIKKIKNNECLILYINKPIINNLNNKTNMIKDKRIFSFDYDNNCNWYINDMSTSLWPK